MEEEQGQRPAHLTSLNHAHEACSQAAHPYGSVFQKAWTKDFRQLGLNRQRLKMEKISKKNRVKHKNETNDMFVQNFHHSPKPLQHWALILPVTKTKNERSTRGHKMTMNQC